jgi:hypothetical protein
MSFLCIEYFLFWMIHGLALFIPFHSLLFIGDLLLVMMDGSEWFILADHVVHSSFTLLSIIVVHVALFIHLSLSIVVVC